MKKTNQTPRPLQARAGQVARELGIGVQTLHFYEREGLIPPPERSEAGYRLYSPDLIDRVGFIRKAQALGLPLHEIKDILALFEHGTCPCGLVKVGLEKKLADIDRRLMELGEFRRELSELIEQSDEMGTRAEQAGICSIVEEASHRVVASSMESQFPARARIRNHRQR